MSQEYDKGYLAGLHAAVEAIHFAMDLTQDLESFPNRVLLRRAFEEGARAFMQEDSIARNFQEQALPKAWDDWVSSSVGGE